jgi:hypothetical protein
MPDYPIDPELRIRGSPRVMLRRTTEATDRLLRAPTMIWINCLGQSF